MRKIECSILRNSKEDFNAFLAQCKRAFDKSGLAYGSTKYDQWSARWSNRGVFPQSNKGENLTVWEGLKRFGCYSYNCEGIAIDLEFGNHVYVETWEEIN